IRTGRIAWCGTYTDILFFDQLFIAQAFLFYIAPVFFSYLLMKQFSKSLGQPVGKSLQHDLVIIIMSCFKFLDMRLDILNSYGESSDKVFLTRCLWSNEICKREIRLIGCFLDLLTQSF